MKWNELRHAHLIGGQIFLEQNHGTFVDGTWTELEESLRGEILSVDWINGFPCFGIAKMPTDNHVDERFTLNMCHLAEHLGLIDPIQNQDGTVEFVTLLGPSGKIKLPPRHKP